jgi:hypothetical protein
VRQVDGQTQAVVALVGVRPGYVTGPPVARRYRQRESGGVATVEPACNSDDGAGQTKSDSEDDPIPTREAGPAEVDRVWPAWSSVRGTSREVAQRVHLVAPLPMRSSMMMVAANTGSRVT